MFHSSLLLLIFGQLSAQNLRPRAGRAALAGRACPKICFFLVYCGSKYLENGLALSAAKNWKEKRVFLFRFSKTLVCMLTLLLSLGSGMALGRLMTSASGRWRGWGLPSSSGQRFPKPSWGRPRPRQLRPPLHRELRRSERIICFFRAVYFAGAPNFFFFFVHRTSTGFCHNRKIQPETCVQRSGWLPNQFGGRAGLDRHR